MAGWGLITFLPNVACLLRRHWQRPRLAPPLHPRQHYPKVSLHLPCYAEPPEVICATLATLADLDYPHYEVLVVDNNTPDRHLWEPIDRYCHELNILAGHVRFRFFHVDNLAGAKAGALNYALARTATDADLIGVVDADYQVNGDFLARLVGFFDDPAIGFVQTPHDYRDWQQSWYLRGCYWEYMSFFRLQLAGLNEWSASYIIGTMCLIRKAALMELGGWAQWCLTEDSELAVRIHSGGYQSLFLTESFGKGLIPETFAGYKKQRLRWTMGPIQQLRRHWRQYLPRRWSVPTQLTGIQKFLELSHSLSGLFPLFIFVQLPLTGAWLFHLQQHQVTIPLPNLVWYSAVNTLIAGLGLSWLTYYLLGCRQWRDMGMAMMAMMALQHTKTLGALKAVLTPQSLQWQRTNKFCVFPQRWRAFQSTQTECLLSLLFAGAAIALGSMATSRPDFVWLVIAQCAGFSLSYGSAIIMAHLAEVDIAEQKKYLGTQDCKPLLPSHSVKGTL